MSLRACWMKTNFRQQAREVKAMYSKINQYLHDNNALSGWKAIHQLIDLIIYEKSKHIRIPGVIGETYGCAVEEIVPASACLLLAFASIIVMGDFQIWGLHLRNLPI